MRLGSVQRLHSAGPGASQGYPPTADVAQALHRAVHGAFYVLKNTTYSALDAYVYTILY